MLLLLLSIKQRYGATVLRWRPGLSCGGCSSAGAIYTADWHVLCMLGSMRNGGTW